MKYLVAGLVLCVATIASADPLPENSYSWRKPNTAGVFVEVGGGWQRVSPNGFTYRAAYLRIAPQVSVNRFIYLGAAFEAGKIYSAYGMPDRSIGATIFNDYTDEGHGSLFTGQVFVGARDLIGGIFSVGGDVGPTVRETSAGENFKYSADKTFLATIEVHGRADVWATPHISAGVMIGMDVSGIRDFMSCVQVGFHLEPYDAMASKFRR